MERKYLEMFGMAASIGTECRDCLEWHLNAAREAGATAHELKNTIKMAMKVRQVSIDANDKFTSNLMDYLKSLADSQSVE